MEADYAAAQAGQAQWQNKIFHTEVGTSLGHCFALCRIGEFSGGTYECNIVSYDATSGICYLGNSDKNTPSHTAPAGLSTVYMDRGNL